jgi:hypothetical protein
MRFRRLALALALAVAGGCSSPSGPTPPPPVDPGPVVNNTPPVIGKFTVQGTRPNEPADFADASEDVPISVEVTDAESPIANLKFNWSTNVGGTFSGTGNKVIWKAPATVAAPMTATVTLEVVETYTSQGKSVENHPTASTTLSLHDSVKEVGDMARQFLLDFSDSRITDVSYIMRNFDPTCYGTADETAQVTANRVNFNIVESRIDQPATNVQFGGICPYRFPTLPGDACAQVRSYWKSVATRDIYDNAGNLYLRKGQADVQNGIDQVAAMYYKSQQHWRLCDSSWKADSTSSLKAKVFGLVP